MTLFEEMNAAGLVTGHRDSDLYVLNTTEARQICLKHGRTPEPFNDAVTGKHSLEIPFAFDPFWQARSM